MEFLIIFTRIDDFTREYFQNFFGNIQNENNFILQVENLLFVSDTNGNPEIFQLVPLVNKLRANHTFLVFYHKTANALNSQINFIRNNILNEIEFEIYDHHNVDGTHFHYVVNASKHYKDGKIGLFKEQIALLIQNIRDNHGLQSKK